MNIAGIDIGTNSVRLLITDERGVELVREMTITRLGQDVDATGALSADAMSRTLDVLEHFGQLLRKYNAQRLRMTATSAARDAVNRAEFFREVQARVGQSPELISGEEEAKLSFAGATSGLALKDSPFLIFDIGGGSTEFALGRQTPESFISVDMGGVRMTERFLLSDPPTPAELEGCRQFVRAQLVRVERAIPVKSARTWLGLAGTTTSCAAWSAKLTQYDASATHGYVLSPVDVRSFFQTMAEAPVETRRQLLVNPKRAEVITGGALVLDAIVEHFGIESLRVSERDILDGLAASALG